jgi:amidase
VPLTPPNDHQLAALNEHYGFGLSGEELAEYGTFVGGVLENWDATERLYAWTARSGTGPRRTPPTTRSVPGT